MRIDYFLQSSVFIQRCVENSCGNLNRIATFLQSADFAANQMSRVHSVICKQGHCLYCRCIDWAFLNFTLEPAVAAMHGPHSLVRFGD